MVLPKLSTGALNTYAALPLGSEISPTTSPAASSKQEDSDPNYTPNYEEPENSTVALAIVTAVSAACALSAFLVARKAPVKVHRIG